MQNLKIQKQLTKFKFKLRVNHEKNCLIVGQGLNFLNYVQSWP